MLGCGVGPGSRGSESAAGNGVSPVWPRPGLAIVRHGSLVYTEPRVGAQAVQLGRPVQASPPWPVGGQVVAVVGSVDGFVEVRPYSERGESLCEKALYGDDFDVGLFVSPWSLVPVSTQPLQLDFEDDSSVELKPGAVLQRIEDDPRSRWAVQVEGVRMRLPVPESMVGLSYEPAVVFPDIYAPQRDTLVATRMNFDGEEAMHVDQGRVGSLRVLAVSEGPRGFRVEFMGDCLRAAAFSPVNPVETFRPFGGEDIEFGLGGPSVVVPSSVGLALEPPSPDEIEVLEALEASGLDGVAGAIGHTAVFDSPSVFDVAPSPMPVWVFEQGAPVYLSASGPPSGSLSNHRVFGESAWGVGDRVCFGTTFGHSFVPPLDVCLDAVEGRVVQDSDPEAQSGQVRVVPGPVQVTGALDEVAVQRALRIHRHEVRRCYNLSSGGARVEQGVVTLALGIDGQGAVTSVQRRGGEPGTAVVCAMTEARRWTMPAPTDGHPGTVQFEFSLSL